METFFLFSISSVPAPSPTLSFALLLCPSRESVWHDRHIRISSDEIPNREALGFAREGVKVD